MTVTVSGGAGGIEATYDDMVSMARVLHATGGDLGDLVSTVTGVGQDGDMLASTLLSPSTAARVAEHVAASAVGPNGLVVTAGRLIASALMLRAAAEAYQAVDEALARTVSAGQQVATATFWTGQVAELAGNLLLAGVVDHGDDGLLNGSSTPLLQARLEAQLRDVEASVYDSPWLVDGTVDLLITGQQAAALVVGPILLTGVNHYTRTSEGTTWPPRTVEEGAAGIIAAGRAFGLFEPGTGRAEASGNPHPPTQRQVPNDITGLWHGVEDVNGGEYWTPPDPASGAGGSATVRVVSVQQPDGSRAWVVQIPGTQVWQPTSGANPADVTTNGRVMAGQDTAQNEAVREAMRQAGVGAGEQVMLMGHSQGGITAMSLASDPATLAEFNVTNVATAGSPVARFDVPDRVTVLSLEHDQDPVPRLDSQPNPERSNWVTVTRDPTGDPIGRGTDPDGSPATVDTPFETHSPLSNYTRTAAAAEESGDPSVTRALDTMNPFMSDDPSAVTVRDYKVTREPGDD